MKRLGVILWFFLLLVCCAGAETADVLSVGSRGDQVLEVKKQLHALRYYRTGTLTRQYTEDTAERVRKFQQINGLPETGEVDAATAAMLFSPEALKAPWPTMPPLATPAPTPIPDWPPRDAAGYLAEGGEYYYENDAEGLWIYLSENLQITILRREDADASLIWFETDILTRNGESFRAVATDPERPGKDYRLPDQIAREEGFVLGFSDDFYAYRMNKKETVGIILRNGAVISETTNARTGHHLPNLDMMAQFPDGSLQVYACAEHTAEEFLEMGAVNVFSFGPYLLRDGEINELVYTYFKSLEPRHALGMIAPGHYFLLSVQGRTHSSDGTTLQRVAEMMQAKGVTQALNLDGGNTMALAFHGRLLNEPAIYKNKKFVRTVTSMIGIGSTAYTPLP